MSTSPELSLRLAPRVVKRKPDPAQFPFSQRFSCSPRLQVGSPGRSGWSARGFSLLSTPALRQLFSPARPREPELGRATDGKGAGAREAGATPTSTFRR